MKINKKIFFYSSLFHKDNLKKISERKKAPGKALQKSLIVFELKRAALAGVPFEHEPALHEPALHEPALHEPFKHKPALHKPALHKPALPGLLQRCYLLAPG